MRKLFTLCLVALMSVGAWAEGEKAGFWNEDAGTVRFSVNGQNFDVTYNNTGALPTNLGSLQTLTISEWWFKMWQSADNIPGDGVSFCYRIYPTGGEVPANFTVNWGNYCDFKLNSDGDENGWKNGSRNIKAGNGVANINILEGLADGNYTLEYYFTANMDVYGTTTTNATTAYLSNGGSNYKVTFTIVDANNIFKSATTNFTSWFGDAGWAPINTSTASWNAATGTVTANINQEPYGQWHAQLKLQTTGITLDPAKTYKFSCSFNSTHAFGGVTAKIFDDVQLSYKADIALGVGNTDYESTTFQGGATGNGIIVFDLGNAVNGATVTITNITLEEVEPEPAEPIVYNRYATGHTQDPNWGDPNGRILVTLQKLSNTSVKVLVEPNNPGSIVDYVWVNFGGQVQEIGTPSASATENAGELIIGNVNTTTANTVCINWHTVGMDINGRWTTQNFTVQPSELFVAVSDEVAPTISTASVTSYTHNTATIDVTAEDNIGVTGYVVKNGEVVLKQATETPITLTGLTAETTYNLTVYAKDLAGNVSTGYDLTAFTTNATPASPYCEREIGHLGANEAEINSFVLLSIGSDGEGHTIVNIKQDIAKNSTIFDVLHVNCPGAYIVGTDIPAEFGGATELGVSFNTPTPDANGEITLEILWSKVGDGGRWMVQNVKVPADAQCAAARVVAMPARQYDLNVTAAGWASLCLPFDAEVPAGATAYYAKAADATTVTLSPIDEKIPANQGVVVAAAEGPHAFVETTGAATITNLFEGTTAATPVGASSTYVLNATNSTPGAVVFSTFTGTEIPAYKAYLPANAIVGAPERINFVIEGSNPVATGIENAAAAKVTKALVDGKIVIVRGNQMFNLNGQLVK